MSTHSTHYMHSNSLAAHAEERSRLSQRCREIVEFLKARNAPASDRQIMDGLGFTDPNTVRPRITELLEAGILREHGNVTDRATGKTVRLVELSQSKPSVKPVAQPVGGDLFAFNDPLRGMGPV